MKRFAKASDIKVGVIGYGGSFNMGKIHLTDCQKAGMTPVAVTDMDPSRLKTAEQDFPGIGTFTSVSTMLKKSPVNLIIIITPHNTHAKLALQCLNAGRHVVCEKPLAITTAECDAMIAAAKRKGVMLSTYHNRHWDGCIMETMRVVKSGAIGDVIRVEGHMGTWGNPGDWWRTSKSISGGILYDWGVHELEYILQIIKSDIREVSGHLKTGFWASKTRWKKDTNEDEGFITIRFKSGQWATLCITAIDSRPKEGMMEITGTKGSVLFDIRNYWVYTHGENGSVITEKGANMKHQYPKYYKNIADHLTKNKSLVITPEWSRRPIHILDLAHQSAKAGKAVMAKYK